MQITGTYSHKDGESFIQKNHPNELNEVENSIKQINIRNVLNKISHENRKPKLLFLPIKLNEQIKRYLHNHGWTEPATTKKGFKEPRIKFSNRQYREMDGIKNKVGLEVQFGKYAFMGYDILAKMPIFSINGLIDCGIEIVVMRSMLKDMSTGVSSFEHIKLDLENRGVADKDIPTLIIGFECTPDDLIVVSELREQFKRGY